jgi:GH24 family phage-related lysozyme (muramidase)
MLMVKRWEALTPKATWDVNAYRNGWGTKALSRTETISKKEADIRTTRVFDIVHKDIRRRYPCVDEWPALVLSVMDYNVSRFGPRLNRAIRSGDLAKVAAVMPMYNKSAGKVLDGLTNRRNSEAAFLLTSAEERQELAVDLQRIVNNHSRKSF